MTRAPFRRFLAVVTTAAVLLGVSPALAESGPGALSGRIFASNATTPIAGVTVKAANLSTETIYDSTPTDGNGRFTLEGLPAGPYELAVATADGLYPTRTTLVVESGQTRVLSLALSPATTDDEDEGEPAEGEEPAAEDDDDDKGAVGFWDRTWVATLTIVGFAAVLGVAADQILGNDEPVEEVFASPSAP